MVILYPSYDINKLKGSVNSGSPFIFFSRVGAKSAIFLLFLETFQIVFKNSTDIYE